MTPNEKALIQDLFTRLRAVPASQRDAEAEQLITSEMFKTPGAAYALAQTVLVQDQALREAHERVKAAEAAAETAKRQAEQVPQRPQPEPASGGILGRLGLGGAQGGAAQQQPAQDQGGGGGGFMRGALQTAAGVAGGALLFEGVRSLFSGGHGGGFGGPWGGSSFLGGGNEQPVVNETIINDYSGDRDRPSDDDGYRDASFDDDSGFDNDDSGTI